MKFNWRANWEILLVLVIIVVGIVITTIAAIKNKDNHLLALPEETDFRQLLATNGDGGTYPDSTNSSTSLHQQDLHNSNADLDEDSPTIGGSVLSSSRGSTGTNNVQSISKPTQSSRYQSNHHQHQHQQQHHHQHHHQAKYDDNAEYNKPNIDQQIVTTGSARFTASDSYEPMSTEPTPDQVRLQSDSNHNGGSMNNHHNHHGIFHNSKNHHARQYSSSRRHVNRTTQLNSDENGNGLTNHQPSSHYNDQLGDSVDLIDDIHTTRSSLVGANQHNNNINEANQNKIQLGSSQTDHNQLPLSSLTLHGPYGSIPASMNNILLNNANHKLESGSSLIELDDLANSYSRLPSANGGTSNNITDNVFNNYNLATTLGSSLNDSNSSQQQKEQQQILNTAMLANLLGTVPSANNPDSVTSSNSQDLFGGQQQQTTTATPNHHRGFSSLLPISFILSDLLRIARPHTSASNDQQSRPSILQQSRLPGSFLSLIQGLTATNGGNTNLNDINSYMNHDASESNQHYHRISMSPTDIHSILARSLGTSGVLPAFPAPKGVNTPWIPPTSGGSPDYNSAFNSNADFVAGNVAGFIRAAPVSSASEQGSHQYNNQSPIDTPYQRQSIGNTDLAPSGQIDNNHQQQQQSQSSLGNIDDLQSQQLFQSTLKSNTDRNWVRASNGPVSFTQAFMRPTGANELDNTRRTLRANTLLPIAQSNPQNLIPADHNNFVNLQTNQQLNIGKPGFNNMIGNDVQTGPIQQHNYNHQQASVINQNQNSPSEMQVPLGYSPPQQMQHSSSVSTTNQVNQRLPTPQPHNIQQIRASFEQSPQKQISMNPMQQASSNIKSQIPMNLASQQQHQQQILRNPPQQTLVGMQSSKNLKRRKRAVRHDERVDEVMSSKYGGSDDEEDDGDLRPISVVSPDGKPMNSGRVRSSSNWKDNSSPDLSTTNDKNSRSVKKSKTLVHDRQVAQSQRSANHLDLRGTRFDRKNDDTIRQSDDINDYPQSNRRQRVKSSSNSLDDSVILEESDKPVGYDLENRRKERKSMLKRYNKKKKGAALDAAGSGLMSKLLGTASTNDELEEELDDDDDASNEKKKEEIDDAEFGIVNDERQNGPQDVMRGNGIAANAGGSSDGGNQVDNLSKQLQLDNNNADSGLSSGSTDNESYMRRNQQRSDIEFYGHPGEETRQLKYGILGSGNYEVVNGGIYPEADESTAAVNSVANYVRKPGGLLSNLPKILSEQVVNTQNSFMPGGRVGSFLQGASTNPNDMEGSLIHTTDLNNKYPLSSPLLELIEANGGSQLFDPNILAQLGSSGSSARTTHHTGQDLGIQTNEDDESVLTNQERDNSFKQRNKVHRLKQGTSNKNNKNKEHNRIGNKSKLANEQNDLEDIDQDRDMSDEHKQHQQQQQQAAVSLKGNTNSGRKNKEFNSGQLQQQQSSISGSRSQGTNQFNSYQILPSKKVTIFSDQDLDSAPSEQKLTSLATKFPLLEKLQSHSQV